MTSAMIGALVLNFSAVVGAITARAGRHSWSPVTYHMAGLVVSGGTMAGFLAIALFIKDRGIGYGLLYWFLSGLALGVIAVRMMDGLRSIMGIAALGTGLFFAFEAFFR